MNAPLPNPAASTPRHLLDSPWVPVAGALASLLIGLFFTFVWAPHPWGWQGIDFYHDLARGLARGEGFGTTDVPWGFAAFVAACYAVVGERPWVPLVIQVVANATIPLMLYSLVAPLAGRRTAAVASLGIGVFSFNTLYASTQASDALCTVLFLAGLLAFARGLRTDRRALLALAGFLCGVAAQFRPNLLLFPFVLLAGLAWQQGLNRKAAIGAAVLLAAWAAALAPWTIRNYRLTGDFLPTSSHGAIQLWYGTLQVGPYLENFSRNPRAVFASPSLPYSSRINRPVVVSVDERGCWSDPQSVRVHYWTNHDALPRQAPVHASHGRLVFTIPRQPDRAVVYMQFEADWTDAEGRRVPPSPIGGLHPVVYLVSTSHLVDQDLADDLLDVFDVVRLVRQLAWPGAGVDEPALDLDRDGRISRQDLTTVVAALLPGVRARLDVPHATHDVATLSFDDGSVLRVPRDFSGLVTDLEITGEQAERLLVSHRLRALLDAPEEAGPPPCRLEEDLEINAVFYRRELDRMSRYIALAMDNVRRDPWEFVAASAYRSVRMFVVRPPGDRATVQQFQAASVAYSAGLLLSLVYLTLFVAGVVIAWRRSALLALLPAILYMPMTLAVVLTNMRYTVTVQPLMFAFVALAVVTLLRLDREGRGRGSKMIS